MQILPKEILNILLDDLVTAFKNKLRVLQKRRLKSEMQFSITNIRCSEVLQNS